MKYIRTFSSHIEYEAFTATTAFVKPNLSFCENDKGVHYTPRACKESTVYELVGEPSYPSTVAASATSFELSFDYNNIHTSNDCKKVITSGSNTVSIEISANTTTSARTISGYYDFNGLNVQYTLTQEGEIKCEESNVYELIGEPSYPSTVAASATSFNLSFDYKNTHTTITCESIVTTGSNTVSIEITENTTTSARTISGYYDFNGLNVQYTLTQEGKSEIPYAQSYAYYPFNGDIKDYSGNGRNLEIRKPSTTSTVNIESDHVKSTGGRLVAPFRMNNAISSTVSFTVFTPSNLNSDKDRYIFSAMLNANPNWINTRYCFGVPEGKGNKYYFGSQAGQINNYTNGNNWGSNRTGGLNSCYNLPSINLNSKNNITIVRDVTNSKFKIYVNGTLDFEANMLDNRGGTSSSYYFTLLDEDSNRGRGYHFVDKLYNFVYWDYVLSNSEISAVANDLRNN